MDESEGVMPFENDSNLSRVAVVPASEKEGIAPLVGSTANESPINCNNSTGNNLRRSPISTEEMQAATAAAIAAIVGEIPTAAEWRRQRL